MTTVSTQNSTWSPAPSVLKLDNCDELAQIWSWYQLPESFVTLERDIKIIRYFFQGLKDYLDKTSRDGLSRPSDNEVLAWIRTSAVKDFINKLALGDYYSIDHPGIAFGQPKPECWLQVCRVQRWDGNPDVAGVGVRHQFNDLSHNISVTIADACNIHTPDMPRHGLSHRTRHGTL